MWCISYMLGDEILFDSRARYQKICFSYIICFFIRSFSTSPDKIKKKKKFLFCLTFSQFSLFLLVRCWLALSWVWKKNKIIKYLFWIAIRMIFLFYFSLFQFSLQYLHNRLFECWVARNSLYNIPFFCFVPDRFIKNRA